MEPTILGKKYDHIASWWHEQHVNSQYGVKQVQRALAFTGEPESQPRFALDVGCGAGGRFVREMTQRGFTVTGLDVSEKMIEIAKENHPDQVFLVQDICSFETDKKFDFILAWDSIFHLPLTSQKPVLVKLCGLLADNGVLVYTFGDAIGEHDDTWHNDRFHYSSIGISHNLQTMIEQGVTCKHMELDQWPLNHVYVIGQNIAIEPAH